jgi:uncharacterized membrane protein
MPDYERSMTVSAHPDRVFDYVADIAHLPEYLEQMKAVQRTGAERVEVTAVVDLPGEGDTVVHDQAWFRADPHTRRVEWGSLREDDYHGSLDVRDPGDHVELAIFVHTMGDEAESSRIEERLDRALGHIRDAVAVNAA